MLGFEESYEICNCKRVTIKDIVDAVKSGEAKTLRDIQDVTTAGTECRHCVFPEGDFGRIKKKVYCKDILNELKKEMVD